MIGGTVAVRFHGPSIWFQVVPETKIVKNRVHLDIHASGGRSG
jgi:hypothetical protein